MASLLEDLERHLDEIFADSGAGWDEVAGAVLAFLALEPEHAEPTAREPHEATMIGRRNA